METNFYKVKDTIKCGHCDHIYTIIPRLECLCNCHKNLKIINSNCLHDNCELCNGTGFRKDNGSMCIHAISCPCSKCSATC